MYLILIYDISHNGCRNKVASLCLDYGLDRIQFSAFVGQLPNTHQEALMMEIKHILGKREAKIRLIPICAKDWARQIVID